MLAYKNVSAEIEIAAVLKKGNQTVLYSENSKGEDNGQKQSKFDRNWVEYWMDG